MSKSEPERFAVIVISQDYSKHQYNTILTSTMMYSCIENIYENLLPSITAKTIIIQVVVQDVIFSGNLIGLYFL